MIAGNCVAMGPSGARISRRYADGTLWLAIAPVFQLTVDILVDTRAMQSRWRRAAAPIIARVLAENAGRPEADVRAALRAAYPFGPRKHHPYRIWLDEVRIQTGRRQLSGREHRLQGRPPRLPDPRQELLFA
jgi:hypothetical protein